MIIDSPIDRLHLTGTDQALTGVYFANNAPKSDKLLEPSAILEEAKKQLGDYFAGDLTTFNLPLKYEGTEFEQSVWRELKQIPYGTSITYKELAHRLGDTNKVRAVGRANGKNPLPIVIPCHRVIGSNNKLVGYGGGIERKKWLLRHEGALLL